VFFRVGFKELPQNITFLLALGSLGIRHYHPQVLSAFLIQRRSNVLITCKRKLKVESNRSSGSALSSV
jgi:hypothetical protein